ncbi:uncharacterized protein LACBIDRAFT_308169 [Laccaria bicolor S238N-H82]|uniref:Predicted protein n=1 Tax=Laccaria bicolor (strain S238N-H82 / ATCC MYA-4686) TaxID=486041 RepID=B0DRR7_LACBS|nr:uncharacterized protein LACBIDRAFT_308169 [Laccaria bicolor S238N-H82]EDR02655.1 predicted protein [Laccaria bicolor S238N-H82]|eukprot:XP_001886699.1 predicted protein [Laccaria bicolor S238N-H82]
MCVEWAKARAQMKRWNEELMLVQEEMRRVIAYHKWRADCGISGYTYKQADICECLAVQCAVHWLPHLKVRGIILSWASDYEHMLLDVPVPWQNADADVNVPSGHPDDEDIGDDNELDSEDRDEDVEADDTDSSNLDDIDY